MTAAKYAEKAGKNLRQIMYDKQVTQAQLSHDLKISKGTVNSWVNGKRLPRAGAMDKICRYLQCIREDILDGPKETISKNQCLLAIKQKPLTLAQKQCRS